MLLLLTEKLKCQFTANEEDKEGEVSMGKGTASFKLEIRRCRKRSKKSLEGKVKLPHEYRHRIFSLVETQWIQARLRCEKPVVQPAF